MVNLLRGMRQYEKHFQNVLLQYHQWLDVKTWISGDHGVSQWLVKGTGPNGPINQLGCDLWIFLGDKILKKDTYYKQVIA